MSKALDTPINMRHTLSNVGYAGEGTATKKNLHHDWANGFELTKGDILYHPYTRKDFKFGIEENWH